MEHCNYNIKNLFITDCERKKSNYGYIQTHGVT